MTAEAGKLWQFHGGVHPAENKAQSMGRKILSAGIPPQLILPLSQSIGAAPEPLVQVGDKVLKGQVLAQATAYVSVPLHAPTSGIVAAIEERQIAHASGLSAQCIVIDTDGKDEWVERDAAADYTQLERTSILKLIRGAGIAGMGGAGFPSAVKLNPPPDKNISTLIINATECEPYITADHALMLERAEEILQGIDVLTHLLQPARILIGVEDNKPDAAEELRAQMGDRPYQVMEYPTVYPSGGEKQLVEILTGKQVPSGGLPADLGIVCQNIGTCYAIKRAVIDGEPLVSRITTLTGEALREKGNFEVLIGTPMRFLLELSGWQVEATSRLIMGGPMMGFTVHSADVPVVKTTNCVLSPTVEELPPPPIAQACIRCGMCAEACPASLLPQQLYWFSRAREYEQLEAHNIADCIECGACSYVCPSNIPLVQYYRASKAELKHRAEEHRKAEYSRERFEFRELRLQEAEREKEAKKAARKAAAEQRAKEAKAKEAAAGSEQNSDNGTSSGTDGVDTAIDDKSTKQAEIQAAIARVKAKKASDNGESNTEEKG
ncbi:MAG: electron transport complex subunit RsxC [Pseudomonadales bacterium]